MTRSSCPRWLALAALLAIACGDPAAALPDAATGCNGREVLCDRPLDEVTFAATHNSFASEERGYNAAAMNQFTAVPGQLADGIRGLNFDLHEAEDGSGAWLCHQYCPLGWQPLGEALVELRTFLEASPREVVLLVLESYVPASVVEDAFAGAGLLPFVHAQPQGEAWPTLGEMIATGRRLVVLTDHEGGALPWYHPEEGYLFDTAWGVASAAELSCDLIKPQVPHGLFELDHTLTDPLASPELAEQINHNPFFLERARQCAAAVGKNPSIVAVDFYEIGDLLEVVDALNGP